MTSLALFSLLYFLSVFTLTDSSLSSITTAAPPAASKCTLLNSFQPGFFVQGDYVIGGIFPLHFNLKKPDLNGTYRPPPINCNGHRLYPRAFRWAQAMRLAVEEINQNPALLLNHTLGYKIFDSCGYPLTGQRAVLSMLNGLSEENSSMCTNGSSLLAVIGASGSAQSIVLSRILQPFRIPMISYSSSCACLSDRQKYPTFFRVIPSDDYQVKAIARLLVQFNWTWVGLLRGDNDYGRFAAKGLLRELQETKVCVAYQEMIPLLYTRQGGLRIMKV
ncbi:extracellular calcium-sensing receptor-like [Solea senegalensis]|uniref:Extracellular calcium-sensing receptor-like n=1 Tax=Solea senegalensis TaxID=28829 RepID=A0AAV6QWE5_SOLSE|nr:extracellular calcium-sensing receptor-like [Solea senegalensis]